MELSWAHESTFNTKGYALPDAVQLMNNGFKKLNQLGTVIADYIKQLGLFSEHSDDQLRIDRFPLITSSQLMVSEILVSVLEVRIQGRVKEETEFDRCGGWFCS